MRRSSQVIWSPTCEKCMSVGVCILLKIKCEGTRGVEGFRCARPRSPPWALSFPRARSGPALQESELPPSPPSSLQTPDAPPDIPDAVHRCLSRSGTVSSSGGSQHGRTVVAALGYGCSHLLSGSFLNILT